MREQLIDQRNLRFSLGTKDRFVERDAALLVVHPVLPIIFHHVEAIVRTRAITPCAEGKPVALNVLVDDLWIDCEDEFVLAAVEFGLPGPLTSEVKGSPGKKRNDLTFEWG